MRVIPTPNPSDATKTDVTIAASRAGSVIGTTTAADRSIRNTGSCTAVVGSKTQLCTAAARAAGIETTQQVLVDDLRIWRYPLTDAAFAALSVG